MGEIREGQKAKLLYRLIDDSQREVDCFIKEIHSDRLSLEYPDEVIDYLEYFSEGEELLVKIFTPSGVKVFDAVVINSPLERDFVIEYVEGPIKIQRREYIRIEAETKVIIEREDADNIVTQTTDIGGGGIRFSYGGSFFPNENVGCLLYLPLQVYSVKAKGVIIKPLHLTVNEHVLQFTEIDERDRDRIIKKCFELQSAKYRIS